MDELSQARSERSLLRQKSTLIACAVLFLNELEEILEFIGAEQLEVVYLPLFRVMSKCVGSVHFQVAERALFFWNNEHLLNVSTFCLNKPVSNAIAARMPQPSAQRQDLAGRVRRIARERGGPLEPNRRISGQECAETLCRNRPHSLR